MNRGRTRYAFRWVAFLTVLLSMGALVGAQSASAAPPSGSFLNPSATGVGSGSIISDKTDGTDGLYHFVVRAKSNGAAGTTVTGVQIQGKKTADATYTNLGNATQVGSTDTWQLKWDQSASALATAGAGTVQAIVTQSDAQTNTVGPVTATFDDTQNATEMSYPSNGGNLGFDGTTAIVTGTASAGTTSVTPSYTKTTDPGTTPTWIACAGPPTATFTSNPDGTRNFAVECNVTPDAGSSVTGVAVVTNSGSGDAHRVVNGYTQIASSVQITPSSATQSINHCQEFTAKVLDTAGNPMDGERVDIRAAGPATTEDFATYAPTSGFPTDDANTKSPLTAVATNGQTEAVCASNGTVTTAAGASAANAGGTTGVEGIVNSDGSGKTKQIDGTTDPDGFQFALTSDTTGSASITGWNDSTANDTVDGSEPSGSASATWTTIVLSSITVTPSTGLNASGSASTLYTATAKDTNGNFMNGVVVSWQVTAGPNSTSDLDGNVSTPGGFFGTCTTAGSGACTKQYTDMAAHSPGLTDTVRAFNDANHNASFDSGETNGTAGQSWYLSSVAASCVDLEPNSATRPTGSSQAFTVYMTDGSFGATDNPGTNDCSGNPIVGAALTFSRVDSSVTTQFDNSAATEDVVTNASGQAVVTLTETTTTTGSTDVSVAGKAGTTYNISGGSNTGPNTVTWAQPGAATSLVCTPTDQLQPAGGNASFDCTVTDGLGNPVANASHIDGIVTSSTRGNATADLDGDPTTPVGMFADDKTADGSGNLTLSYHDLGTGTSNDTVVIFLDPTENDTATDTPNSGNLTVRWNSTLSTAKIAIDMQPTGSAVAPPGPNVETCNGNFATFGGATWETSDSETVGKISLVCVGVADSTNAPIQSATVTVSSTGVGQLTDATGFAKFYVRSTATGAQHLSATAANVPGSASGTENWTAGPGFTVTVSPTASTITTQHTQTEQFTVVDSFGNPASGENVVVSLTNTPSGSAEFSDGTCCAKTITTGTDGKASVDVKGVQAGSSNVAGTDPACSGTGSTCTASATITIKQGGAYTVTVSPTTASIATGQIQTEQFTVVDAQGSPVDGQEVSVSLSNTPSGAATFSDGTSGPKSVTTNANGHASVDVKGAAAGSSTVTGTATGPDSSGQNACSTTGANCTASATITITQAGTQFQNLQAAPKPVRRGRTLHVSGGLTSANSACDSGKAITVDVTLKNGRVLHGTANTDSSGNFSVAIRIPRRAALGTVHITVSFAGDGGCGGATDSSLTDRVRR